MIYSEEQLSGFWYAASHPVSVAIVGGGRWGRVWADVVVRARGSADGVAIISRSRADDLRRWRQSQPRFARLTVSEHIAGAFAAGDNDRMAIVASRPSQHVQDGMEALGLGAHLLVEKPLSDNAGEAETLIRAAFERRRLLGIGTEFALLPAFHQAAAALRENGGLPRRMELIWTDPEDEVRHGALKSRHQEVGALVDILPHAVSIFSVFAPDESWRLASAKQSRDRTKGELLLTAGSGCQCRLVCDQSASARRRTLVVHSESSEVAVDFAGTIPSIVVNGEACALSPALAAFGSTLRLELGAFLDEMMGRRPNPTIITSSVPRLCALHRQLDAALMK